MSTTHVNVRLPAELVVWMDGFAKERRWNRTTVLTAALEALRGDAAGGVPEPTRAVASAAEQAERTVTPQSSPRAPVVPRKVWNRGARQPRPAAPEIEGVRRASELEGAPLPRIAARRVR